MSDMNATNSPEKGRSFVQMIYRFFASAKLAMVLLVVILGCCLAGATMFSYERASELIFYSLWFNGLLVLLVINVAACFFGRIWGRKITVISFGMIVFHLSFVGLFLGVVYNSLFYFRGEMRITEGETLVNSRKDSYVAGEMGRLFKLSWLKGETTLNKVYSQYKVEGVNKRYAYELTVGDQKSASHGIIYATRNLDHHGTGYYCDREGYSVLAVLSDRNGREIYGAHIPLQSLKEKPADTDFYYTTGSRTAAGTLPFPQEELKPLYDLQMRYYPASNNDRGGEVYFRIWPYADTDAPKSGEPFATGRAPVNGNFAFGDHVISPREIRYWVGINVKFEPGKPLVMAFLWLGLGGLIITFMGRMLKPSPGVKGDRVEK